MVQSRHASVYHIRSGSLSFHISEMSFSIPKTKLTREILLIKKCWNIFGQMYEGKKKRKKKKTSPFVLLAKHVLISYSKVFSTSLTDMSLKVEKNSRIFRSRSVMSVGSGYALRAWKILDFGFPRYFNIAILATKTALKHQWKSSITLANPIANIIVKTKLTWRKNRLLSRSTHNWTQSVFFYWMRMGAGAQCS